MVRSIKDRRAIVWLDDANWPTYWTMEWYLNGDLHTQLGAGVVQGLDVVALVERLDQLPVKVDPEVLDRLPWIGPYNDRGTSRVKFHLPGWAETQRGHNWYLPVQGQMF